MGQEAQGAGTQLAKAMERIRGVGAEFAATDRYESKALVSKDVASRAGVVHKTLKLPHPFA